MSYQKDIVVSVSGDYKPDDGTPLDAVTAALEYFHIPARLIEVDRNRNFYVAVRADVETDAIVFAKEKDAKEFCEIHPEYSLCGSAVCNNIQEALDIFGENYKDYAPTVF